MQMHLTRALERPAQTHPRGVATLCGERIRTWLELRERVARLAGGLRSLGVGPGDRVAILALNSERYLEFLFAVAWCGGAFVPVNTRLAPPEVAYWLADSGARVLFVDDAFLPMLDGHGDAFAPVRHHVFLGDGQAPAGMHHHEHLIAEGPAVPDALRGGDDLAGIFYTGGTTGVSKGVMLSHRNLFMNAMNVVPALHFDRHARWLHAAPMFHLADGTATFAVALAGGSHAFVPRFEPKEVLEAIERMRCTHSVFVPTMVNMLVNHPDIGRHDLSSMRGILYGASPMPESVILRALEVMPEVGFHQGYGQTEAAPMITVLGPEYHRPGTPEGEKMRSVGQAALAVEVAILDEHDREVPRGKVGQICARGPTIMLGYRGKPELTRETLRNGWLHTGDAGYMDEDGFVYLVDRLKDMIISGGENVYSAEVENALHRHPAVAECAVIGVPDDEWGERVHAIVRLHPGRSASPEELIAHCRRLIAGYKCPRSVELREAPLPLSGAGKILKTELRRPWWEGRERGIH